MPARTGKVHVCRHPLGCCTKHDLGVVLIALDDATGLRYKGRMSIAVVTTEQLATIASVLRTGFTTHAKAQTKVDLKVLAHASGVNLAEYVAKYGGADGEHSSGEGEIEYAMQLTASATSAHAYLRDLCANVGDLGTRPDLAVALGRMALRIGDRLVAEVVQLRGR